jgi:hypothetical protein
MSLRATTIRLNAAFKEFQRLPEWPLQSAKKQMPPKKAGDFLTRHLTTAPAAMVRTIPYASSLRG